MKSSNRKYGLTVLVSTAMVTGFGASALAGPDDVRPWQANRPERSYMTYEQGKELRDEHREVKKDCKDHDKKQGKKKSKSKSKSK